MADKKFEEFKKNITEHYSNIDFAPGAIGEMSETIVNVSTKITLEILQQYHNKFIEGK